MHRRRLGKNGPEVSALGLGCMGMSQSYGTPDEAESVAALHRAPDLGIDLIDTADAYGEGHNESLIGRAIKGRRGRYFVATKFGNIRGPGGKQEVCGTPDYVRKACDASLQRLGIETIDLYYQHRVDPNVPIEDTVGAMADLVKAGKVRQLGLSEAAPATVRRAHAVHPIAAVQSEWSLWTRDPEAQVLPTCRALGIAFVPYSPFGRGFLTGTIDRLEGLEQGDRRREHPRFAPDNLARNLRLLDTLKAVASERGTTPALVALAWLLAQGSDIVPIPGTKRVKYLEQNVRATGVALSADDMARLDRAFPPGITAGDRYPAPQMKRIGL